MIVLLGIAGSGKTTQGRFIADLLDCKWLSVGQLVRDHIKGENAQRMSAGELLGDEVIISLMEPEIQKLSAQKHEFVLDGAPRQLGQAKWLMDKVESGDIKLTAIIHLQADREIVKQRLLKRGRADDTEASIETRFGEYDRNIVPILDYLKEQNIKVHDVDANLSVDEVSEQVRVIIQKEHAS